MKNQTFATLFLLAIFSACHGQSNPDLPKEGKPQASLSALNPFDEDPYFIGNRDIERSYGPRHITRNIIQDKNEQLWFATWDGIIRYDGKQFTNLTNKAGLRRYRAFSLLEDKLQNIWIGTIGAGAYCYNGSTYTNYTSADGLGDNEVECMFLDNVGNIWFGTGAGVSCYNGKTFRNFTVNDGLADTDVHSIAQDKKGNIWIGSKDGISIFDGLSIRPFNNAAGQPFDNVRTIIVSQNGDVWFGGNDGLNRYDGSDIVNLMTDFVGYLYEDKKGDIWISAGHGSNPSSMTLYRCSANTYPLVAGAANFTAIKTEKGLVFGVYEDTSGKIWYGTLDGVCCYDGASFNCFEE